MRTPGLMLAAALTCLSRPAHAEDRPTEGGLWSFDAADTVAWWEEPTQTVRVHYSTGGPNVTRLADLDEDGVPDYAQEVAERTAEAIALYVALGFRPPLPERAIQAALGGSPAHDVYLVDFGGAADGRFGVDGCTDDGCVGFFVVENDFAGYGYATVEEGITTVTAHESFHGVQAAYAALPDWISEGTAVWAQRQFDPDSADFLRLCDALLADPGRPVFQPPGGPVPAFAYGTALWFDFLTERHDAGLVVDLLEAIADSDVPPERHFESLLAQRDDDLETAWATFARYNLATGPRAGVAESHPYATQLRGIDADATGEALSLDGRFYPLAAVYLGLDHPGGDAWFVSDAPLLGVAFSLHPVADFASDGVVGDPIATWSVDSASALRVYAELPAGGYWIVGANALLSDGPARANLCVAADPADPACPELPESGGSSSSSGGDDPSTSSGEHDASTTSGVPDPSATAETSSCACRSRPRPLSDGLVLVLLVLLLRRRS